MKNNKGFMTIALLIAIAVGFVAAHEASHVVSEKITGQPVAVVPAGK